MFDKFDNKKNPFNVPENFFEDFKASLPSKLPERKRRKRFVMLRKDAFRWISAAIFIGLIILAVDKIHFSQKNNVNDQPIAEKKSDTTTIDKIDSDDDLYSYIQDQSTEGMFDEVMESIN